MCFKCSPCGIETLCGNIENKLEVVHKGIDAIKVVSNEPKEGLNFYLFGRIKPEKEQWFWIETLALIPIDKLANS